MLFRYFVENGVDVNCSYKDETPLTCALSARRFDMIETLLNLGADPDFRYYPDGSNSHEKTFREKNKRYET